MKMLLVPCYLIYVDVFLAIMYIYVESHLLNYALFEMKKMLEARFVWYFAKV